MIRAFLRDSLTYGLAGILSRATGFLLIPLYTRVLAPADYGAVDMLTVFAALVNLTVALEITQAVARFLADGGTPAERRAYASTALWFTLGAYVLFILGGAAGSAYLGGALLDAPQRSRLVVLALVWMAASGILYFAQNQLRWELRASRYAVVSVAASVTTLAVSVLLVVVLRLGVAGVVWAQLVGSAAGALLALWFARESFALTFDGRRLAEMLRFSAPLVPSGIAVFVALYVDRLAIKELMTLADVGVFGIGYRIASLAGLLMMGFQSALTPLVYAHHQLPETPGSLARLFRYFVAAAILMSAGLSLFAPELLMLFTTPDYYGGASVIPLLVPAVLLSGMYIFAPGLGLAKRTGTIALVSTAGAVLNTALNYLLIPVLGIRGAALATLLGAAAGFAGHMTLSQRHYPVPHAWGRMAAAAAVAAAAMAFVRLVPLPLLAGLAVKAVLVLIVLAACIAAGLVRTDELRDGWKAARAKLASRGAARAAARG